MNDEPTEQEDGLRRVALFAKRTSLSLELQEFRNQPSDLQEAQKLVDIQDEMIKVDNEIQASMIRSNDRSNLLLESRQAFRMSQVSTPAARRTLNFNDGSEAIHQVIEASATLSKNLMRIDPCKPMEGTSSISSSCYLRWRVMLMSTIQSLSEAEKESFFHKSAGSYLLDVLEMIPGSQPDPLSSSPFSDIIGHLDKFFKSDGTRRAARLELEAMRQDSTKNEGNLAYLERVAKAAMNCGFPTEEFDEKLMNVISKNASDKKIRAAANEIDRSGKRYSYLQFRDFILHYELFQNNERTHKEEKSKNKQLTVHAVSENSGVNNSGGFSRSSYQPAGARSYNQRDPSRARYDPYRRAQPSQQSQACHRCGSLAHNHVDCPHRKRTCFKCGREGHMQSVCKSGGPAKRAHSPEQLRSDKKLRNVANVEANEENINKVGFKSSDTSSSSEG